MADPNLDSLADDLCAAIEAPVAAWTPRLFDALAGRLARLQRARIAPWRALLSARGVPEDAHWTAMSAVPTLAFRRFTLWAGDGAPSHVFHTSGTSGGVLGRGRAPFGPHGLRVMAASIRANARRMLFREATAATRVLVLAPPPELAPSMIMAYGMAQLVAEHGLPGSRFLVGTDGLDKAGLMAELAASSRGDGPPLTLIGASFGVVHLLDGLADAGVSFVLPEGSRLMHAGGFKGRSRSVGEDDLVAALGDRLGLPTTHCVNLLGMTELASQLYDNVHRDGHTSLRFKVCPPWVRTEVVDPDTLAPVAIGQRGLLCHTDLANLTHPFRVQTDDLGRRLPDGPSGEGRFVIYGRATDDGARGCSLTAEDWIEGTVG